MFIMIVTILGLYGCPKNSTELTENKVRELLAQKRELASQIGDLNSQIQKLVQTKKAEEADEKAVNDFFHPKPVIATSTGVSKK